MSRRLTFESDTPERQALRAWHHGLEDDKGGRALLRRARSPLDVAFVPAYHRLLHALQNTGTSVKREALAAVAGLAAHVKEDRPEAVFAAQMGKPKEGKSPAPVHELRFRRLLTYDTRDKLYPHLTRALRLLDGRANLASLAADVYWWEHPNRRSRKQWAYEYYAVAPKKAA